MKSKNQLIGFVIMTTLVVALIPLGETMAFGNTIVVVLYAISFATGISLATASLSRPYRAFWALGLSIVLVVLATTINTSMAPGEEGGPVLGLIVFGFYLGLPTLIFALLFGLALKPRMLQ
ncbi:MAG: hypothetical protein E7773_11230 [Sphingomonas sp.]|uniref:hypothetical protein n=1 Tax=Sphingomonas sp. TaxID=28214 RepID=UPI0012108AF9|nr:hypothetical protein [Sphingomonas sp.]THD35033.1 MAG: hypothetical protein E7773_11230 [Sphingomonas sp.]